MGPDAETVLALVTARGGSKGLPGKNLAALAGKPLVAWSVEAALGCRSVDRVVVSTDSEDIAQACRAAGGEAPFLRPAELAKDDSPHILAALHALDWLATHEEYAPGLLLLLQPTSPLRTAADIDAATQILRENPTADAVVSVAEADKHPFKCFGIGEDRFLTRLFSAGEHRERRQELPKAFVENGAIYLNRVSSLRSNRTFVPERSLPYLMPRQRSVDIDTAWDLKLAELLLGGGLSPGEE